MSTNIPPPGPDDARPSSALPRPAPPTPPGPTHTPHAHPYPPHHPAPPEGDLVAFACPGCTLIHRLILDAARTPGRRYSFTCPYTKMQITLDAAQTTFPDNPSRIGALPALPLG